MAFIAPTQLIIAPAQLISAPAPRQVLTCLLPCLLIFLSTAQYVLPTKYFWTELLYIFMIELGILAFSYFFGYFEKNSGYFWLLLSISPATWLRLHLRSLGQTVKVVLSTNGTLNLIGCLSVTWIRFTGNMGIRLRCIWFKSIESLYMIMQNALVRCNSIGGLSIHCKMIKEKNTTDLT